MAPRASGPPPRQVAVLAYPGVQSLDVVGPLEVFGRTSRWLDDEGRPGPRYRPLVLAPRRGPLATSSGFALVAERALGREPPRLDTLLVAGGQGLPPLLEDRRLHAWLRAARPRVRRLGSVCTGALLLAQAGLLAGKRATTHWGALDLLASLDHTIRVESGVRVVHDGIITSAGVSAGIDMALAVVEAMHGTGVADETAHYMEYDRRGRPVS